MTDLSPADPDGTPGGARLRPTSGAEALRELEGLLSLQATPEPDAFLGESCSRSLPFVFGGQVAAQSLSAAYRTVPGERRAHSLHAYFLNAGDPQRPLRFAVARLRDGRSFTARQVMVSQGSTQIFTALMSFTADRAGLRHADRARTGLSVDPERLPRRSAWLEPYRDVVPEWWSGPMAMDLRFLGEPPHVVSDREPRQDQQLWMRSDGPLPDEPWLHDCVLTFASDLTLLDPVVLAHGRSWYSGELKGASLDHVIWFHRPVRVDEWLLYEQHSPAASGGRGLGTGSIFTRNGDLVSSVAQEGLLQLLVTEHE